MQIPLLQETTFWFDLQDLLLDDERFNDLLMLY